MFPPNETYTHMEAHVHTYIFLANIHLHAWKHIFVSVQTYIYLCERSCMFSCKYVCMYLPMSTRMFTSKHACAYMEVYVCFPPNIALVGNLHNIYIFDYKIENYFKRFANVLFLTFGILKVEKVTLCTAPNNTLKWL